MPVSKSGNDLCRRCRFLQKKFIGNSIIPIYYCKMYPKGLTSDYMNEWAKECFEAKVTGPWRMPVGTFKEEDFQKHIADKEIKAERNVIDE